MEFAIAGIRFKIVRDQLMQPMDTEKPALAENCREALMDKGRHDARLIQLMGAQRSDTVRGWGRR